MTGFDCRSPSTHVERSVENPDTLAKDRSFRTQNHSVFFELLRSRLERAFGKRRALFSGVKGNQMRLAWLEYVA